MGFAIVGIAGFLDLVREPDRPFDGAGCGYAVFACLAIESVLYAAGTLNRTGTLALGLPLAATLAVGIGRVRLSERASKRPLPKAPSAGPSLPRR